MQIKQRLLINNAILVLSAMIMAAVLLATALHINRAMEQNFIADKLMTALFERLTLRSDYLRTGSERARDQVRAKNEQIGKLLHSAAEKFNSPEDREIVASLMAVQESTGRIIETIIANRQDTGISRSAAFASEIEDRLLSQLNLRVYEAVILGGTLLEASRVTLVSALTRAGWSLALVLLLSSMATLINSLMMSRTIANRINRLRDSATAIGQGNLDHRIDIRGNDELTRLSIEINEMAAHLCTSYHNLENEVAERKQAEQALRSRETILKQAGQMANLGAWEIIITNHDDMNANVLHWSDEVYRIFGYDPGGVAVSNDLFFARVHPDDHKPVLDAVSRAIATRTPYSIEHRLIRPDGTERIVLERAEINFDDQGRPIHIIGAVQDITERKGAEEILQRSNARLDLLAETASRLLRSDSPQQIVDVLCQNVLEFLDCHAFFNFLVDEKAGRLHLNACGGIPADEVKKIEWLDYGAAVCGCAARDNCRIVAEDIHNTPDPRTELVKSYGIRAYACHPLVAKDRVLGTLSFGTRTRDRFSEDDLALMKAIADHVAIAMERKRVEEELRQAKEVAEEASRAKSEFVANMSHEIRTPMTVFLMALEQLQQTNADPASRQLLEMADKAAKSLRGLVDDILDFSRIEAGSVDIADEPFNPIAGMQEIIEMFSLPAREKHLHLTWNAGPDVPPILLGDWFRIRQVLINLINNAIKFTPDGEIDVTVRTQGKHLVFAVADTGIGIPEDKRRLIFESFRQVDSSFHRQYGGSGLGLAICKGLVEMMGGRIAIQGRSKGTTFSFTIPLRTLETTSAPPAETITVEAIRNIGPVHILLADDDPMVLKLINLALTLRGWQTETAATGDEAVEKWRHGRFNVILMDLQMPGMNGLEATRLIREHETGQALRTPIIGFTAHVGAKFLDECRDVGMDHILRKPLEIKELYEAISQFLAG